MMKRSSGQCLRPEPGGTASVELEEWLGRSEPIDQTREFENLRRWLSRLDLRRQGASEDLGADDLAGIGAGREDRCCPGRSTSL